jgi:hypothetical protein
MKRLDKVCPCCNCKIRPAQYWGILAPFIKEITRQPEICILSMLECKNCSHRYFDCGYTEDELDYIYSGYRSTKYLLCRRRSEPWYSPKANSSNLDNAVIEKRKNRLKDFLTGFINTKPNDMVIADVGGDAGQFIPLELARRAFVVEASDQNPVEGVERIDNINHAPSDIDLLTCSHVLEHLPEPADFLSKQIVGSTIRSGCLVYIEVPLERYRVSHLLGSRVYRNYLKLLINAGPIIVFVDFLSVIARIYLGNIFPPLIIKMHEHVNFFSESSLKSLVETIGLELMGVSVEKESSFSTHEGVIRLLAKKK